MFQPVSLVVPRLADWSSSPRTNQATTPAEPAVPAGLPALEVTAGPEVAPEEPWDTGTIDPANVPACPKCDSYELWESMAGNWRCTKCEPPHKPRLLQRKANRLRRLAGASS